MTKELRPRTRKFHDRMYIGKTRKVKGQQYVLYDWCDTLEETKEEIKSLRAEGKPARYTSSPSGGAMGYNIWMGF